MLNSTSINDSSWSNNSTVRHSRGPGYHHQIIFQAILFTSILIGNVTVLLVISLSKRRKRSRMNFFIINLAFADLCVAFVSVLTDIIWRLSVQWYAGDFMCRMVKFMQGVVTYASTYVLVALSLDRLDAIARPMNFTNSHRRARLLIAAAWIVAGVFSLPMFIISSVTERNGRLQCRVDPIILFSAPLEPWRWQIYMTVIAVAIFIIPAVIIALCYVIIVCIIWSKSTQTEHQQVSMALQTTSQRRTTGGETLSRSGGIIPQAKMRTIKMTFVIVLAFILCWTPYFAFDLLDVYRIIPSNVPWQLRMFIQSLATLNSVVNPVIYGLFSSNVCRKTEQRTSTSRQLGIRSSVGRYGTLAGNAVTAATGDGHHEQSVRQRTHAATYTNPITYRSTTTSAGNTDKRTDSDWV